MTTILIIGDNDDTKIEEYVRTFLSSSYQITYLKGSSVEQFGNGYEIVVLDTVSVDALALEECIIVMKADGVPPTIPLPQKSIIIANSGNKLQLEVLKTDTRNVITCGNGKRDTITYSSYTNDGIMVSLGRKITAFSGREIEPLEFPVNVTTEQDCVYPLLAFTALRLLLDDYSSEIGMLY